MPPHYPHRQLQEITRTAVWFGSTSVVLLAGCVDAPGPATSPTASIPVSVAPTPNEPGLVDPIPVEESGPTLADPTPLAADALDPDGWISVPAPMSAPPSEPTVARGEPTLAEPTRAEPTPDVIPAAPSLIPGGLSSTGPTPEPSVSEPSPTSAEPTLADPVAERGATPPTLVADAGQPAANANPKPLEHKLLEVVRPQSLILISPRSPKPLTDSQVASTTTPSAPSQRPAVILPPSSASDAALLSPLQADSLVAIPVTPEADSSLASLDPQLMTPALPTPPNLQPHPLESTTGTPVSPISISRPISAPPTGFTSLFNNKDLTGWEVYDGRPDSWQYKDGVVSCVAPGGGWLRTLELYCDFELRFEYRLTSGGNSGVCLRFPGHGNPSLEGLEIQLLDDRAEKYQSIQPQQATGSLYFVTAPKVHTAARVAGEWNQSTLRCVGDQLQVTINNQLVNEIHLGQLTSKSDGTPKRPVMVRCPMGSVALQSHSTRVDFRNVHIQEYSQTLASGVRWLDLQAGTGDAVPAGATVTVHYAGFLSTGKRFANSHEKGQPATVPLQDVIPGWREGIPGMKVGGKRRLIVPANMAYGAKGFKEVVPPNSTLVYDIDLTGFAKPAESAPATAGSSTSEGR